MPELLVDSEVLRAAVREKYRDVALHPRADQHFHAYRV
jgi:hypothetical protein